MVKIKCDEKKGGCGVIYEVDETKVKEKYFQCPVCSRIFPNPFYNGE